MRSTRDTTRPVNQPKTLSATGKTIMMNILGLMNPLPGQTHTPSEGTIGQLIHSSFVAALRLWVFMGYFSSKPRLEKLQWTWGVIFSVSFLGQIFW
jgi:hypothetical protein